MTVTPSVLMDLAGTTSATSNRKVSGMGLKGENGSCGMRRSDEANENREFIGLGLALFAYPVMELGAMYARLAKP